MTDTLDKALEQPRKRGRPATGAMTPAEKQKAYRERKKAMENDIKRRAEEGKCTELEATRLGLYEICERLTKAHQEIKELKAKLKGRE